MTIDTEKQMDAAEERAELYKDDPREGIQTDVMNAFHAGVTWAQQRALDEIMELKGDINAMGYDAMRSNEKRTADKKKILELRDKIIEQNAQIEKLEYRVNDLCDAHKDLIETAQALVDALHAPRSQWSDPSDDRRIYQAILDLRKRTEP